MKMEDLTKEINDILRTKIISFLREETSNLTNCEFWSKTWYGIWNYLDNQFTVQVWMLTDELRKDLG